ncbi:uncharacterized protein LOC107039766 [Diachasma alloeum]|uniref:uncharacterized protein LOC107039766 n=1 Tax=Diachasma alloeum TaxID=454923 RepID=UPI00073813BF|nr:uncharacterized protein LOC107039766 [Diachasma alloeum]
MCSIESRLGNEQTPRFTMIDSSSQASSSGLATALRDRSSCSIPNQPNRSLPVRPAPHIPCRSLLPRRALPPHSPAGLDSPDSESVTTSSDRSHQDPTVGLIRIEVPHWHNDIRQPYINIVNLSTLHAPSEAARGLKRKAIEPEDSVTTSNCSLIDISHSPDRSDSSKQGSPSSVSAADSPRTPHPEGDSTLKKRRKRKLKRDEEKMEINLEPQPSKMVPPLRLKKIQSLQEDVPSVATWGAPKKPEPQEVLPGFRFYQPRPPDPDLPKDASNYRIVTGTTPPYDEYIDSSTVKALDKASRAVDQCQKDENLRFRQNKLKLKLKDLKKKTVELGREMLRTAMTSPDNSAQETPVEEQIKKLTSLLKKLPEAAARADADCQLEDVPGAVVTSTISGVLQSAPSPEPPKLSPKAPVDFGNSLNVHQVRDTPPVLAKAIAHGEDTEDTWQEFEGLRGLLKITKKGEGKPEGSVVASSVITTTSDSSIHEEIDLDNKCQVDLGLRANAKTEINPVRLRNQVRAIEIKSLMGSPDIPEVIKIDLRKTPSPGEMVIDTTSVLQEFEKRSDGNGPGVGGAGDLGAALSLQGARADALRIRTPAPISSSSEAPGPPASLEDCLGVSDSKDLAMAEQFPTLGNWLARMSAKMPSEAPKGVSKKASGEQIVIESRSPAYQPRVQGYSLGSGKGVGADLSAGGGARENGRRWREGREGQEQRAQEYGSGGGGGGNVQAMQQSQQMAQEYCAPTVPVGRYYPRNYPMDPYGIPYGYNYPSLAAASLWSGAVLQYPFMRPRGLPQGYQPRFPSNVMQYHMPPGSLSQQRAPPPPYALPGQSQVPQAPQDPKRAPEPSRNDPGSYDPTVTTKRAECPPVSMPQGSSYPGQRVQQPQPSRDPYPNPYAEPNPRVSVSESSRDQMNYRQPWRGPILPPGPLGMRNYPINTNWASDPCSLLAALSPATLQNFTTPMPMAQRMRNPKEQVDHTRNCETPHLGKVNYSPNTARTLECSNCALPGPLFKCLGCEVAFYCDDTCQARHWSRHVVSCPKKMPKLKKVVP